MSVATDDSQFESVKGSPSDLRPPEAIEVTVLMPCLNEVRTLGACIRNAQSFFERAGIRGEIVVADNGSSDGRRPYRVSSARELWTFRFAAMGLH